MSKAPKGMVARRQQSSKNSSVTVVTYEPIPSNNSNRVNVHCEQCGKPMSYVGNKPAEFICDECRCKPFKEREKARKLEEATRIHRTCKVCGKPFYIKAEKAEELKAAGMELFTRCYACQQLKKDEERQRALEYTEKKYQEVKDEQ